MAPTTCPLLLESQALIDSLGYIDTEYNEPQAQQIVQHLIRAEMSKFQPSASYLDYLPDCTPTFNGHPRLQNEYKRVAAKVPLDVIDMNRYHANEPTGKNVNDVKAWENAIKQLRVAVEYENARVTNLELQQTYGTKLSKVRAAVVDGLNAQYSHVLKKMKGESDQINTKRKHDQQLNQAKLQNYQRKYDELLSKNYSIKRACAVEEQKLQKKAKVE